ncbi:hypothetical protein GCM10010981_09520 [Dyella nitratireducens]|uniref:Uncharacterized protein n=2 Tax=Dyella nitratireducens TaxID=1849580 RepID=A0ABQ1FMW4_9GAMM|nr:hypothetical protein GCM10010981_09520 [Dyella nitratireducens]GLQ43986.1 hypothetical protein GCM10007902_38360 [Dyella nitratireducens]
MPFAQQPVKTSMHEIKLPGDPNRYWVNSLSNEHGRFKLYTKHPQTDAPVETGKMVRADGKGWRLDNDAPDDNHVTTIVVEPNANQQGPSAPIAGSSHQHPAVHQPESPSDGRDGHAQVDEVNRAKELAESKGFSFPNPDFVKKDLEYQALRDGAYKTIAALIDGGDKMHHVTQVFAELRGILGRKRNAIQLRDAQGDALYRLDGGLSQYLLHKDWRIPWGSTRKEFSFPSEWSIPWLKWIGWKEVPPKYQNYSSIIEGRKAEFEKQIENYANNPPRSYGEVVDFRSRRQKDLNDIIKTYVEDKRMRRQEYVWRRNFIYTIFAGMGIGVGIVYSVDRILAMFNSNK